MGVCLNAINSSVLALTVCEDVASSSGGLVQKEGSLDLVLALFVPRRCRLEANIPPMVIYISGVTPTVSRLGLWLRVGLISESLLDHEPLVAFLQIAQVLANLVLPWQ